MKCYQNSKVTEELQRRLGEDSAAGITDSKGDLTLVVLKADEYRLLKYLSDLARNPEKYIKILKEGKQYHNSILDKQSIFLTADNMFSSKQDKPARESGQVPLQNISAAEVM